MRSLTFNVFFFVKAGALERAPCLDMKFDFRFPELPDKDGKASCNDSLTASGMTDA